MGKVITIELRAETKGAQKELDLITQEILEQKELTIDLQKELLQLEEQLKRTPKNAIGAQRRLKKQIDDLRISIKDNNLGLRELNLQRTKAAKTAKTLTTGTKDLTDQVSKNYGITGLLNTLTGGLASRYRDSYDAVTGLNKGLKGLRGALLATGIGAAVVAIGLLTKNWDKVKMAIAGTTAEQKKFNETQAEANVAANEASKSLRSLRDVVLDETASQSARNQALADLSETVTELNGVTLDQEDALKKVTEATDPYIKAVEARAKAEAFAKIIAEEEANIIREQQKDLTEQISTLDVLKTAFTSFGNASQVAGNLSQTAFENQQTSINKSKTLIGELQTQYQNFLTTALNLEAGIGDGVEATTRKVITSVSTISSVGVQSLETNTQIQGNLLTKQDKGAEEFTQAEINRLQLQAEWNEKTTEQKVATAQNALANVANNLGKETAAGKAAAVASTLISTYQGAQDSYKSLAGIPIVGPALGIAAAAAAVAGGLQTVKSIQSTKTPQTAGIAIGGANISSPSRPAPPSVPPAFNIVGASGTNQLAEAIGGQAQQPVKAFVVSNDVTTAQELDRNIVKGASLG
jgi:hypothetical protein